MKYLLAVFAVCIRSHTVWSDASAVSVFTIWSDASAVSFSTVWSDASAAPQTLQVNIS